MGDCLRYRQMYKPCQVVVPAACYLFPFSLLRAMPIDLYIGVESEDKDASSD
eukprot:COSAG05_NODE_3091_length_2331_cov_1.383513_3_plen_52_part_00